MPGWTGTLVGGDPLIPAGARTSSYTLTEDNATMTSGASSTAYPTPIAVSPPGTYWVELQQLVAGVWTKLLRYVWNGVDDFVGAPDNPYPYNPYFYSAQTAGDVLRFQLFGPAGGLVENLRVAFEPTSYYDPDRPWLVQRYTVTGPPSLARAWGPDVTIAGVAVPTLVAQAFNADDLATPIAELPEMWNASWHDRDNEAGSASLTVANDDPALVLIDDGDVIRFDLHGRPAFSFVVRERERVTLSSDEEAGEVTTLAGPGLFGLLERMLVQPSRGIAALPKEQTRQFSWASYDYDDARWGTAKALAPVANWTPAWYGVRETNRAWPNTLIQWIWGWEGNTLLAPPGEVYFRQTFYLNDAQHLLRLYAACDDTGDVYLDGQHLAELAQWTNDPSNVAIVDLPDVDAGWHVIAAHVEQGPGTITYNGAPFNPAAFAAGVWVLSLAGGVETEALLWTDANWKILPYPAQPPGMTPGDVALRVLGEAEARGCVTITTTFSATHDSAGTPWPIVGDISTNVGRDIFTFFRELSSTYVDMAMDTAGRLSMWVKDTRALQSGSLDPKGELFATRNTTDPYAVNLAALTHQRVD